MQRRSKHWIAAAGIAAVVLCTITFFAIRMFSVSNKITPLTKAIQNAQGVALALRLYSEDHNGDLPSSFDALSPDYLLDRSLVTNLRLVTPGGNITKLPPKTAILTSAVPVDGHIVVVHADYSHEAERQ